MSVPTTPTPLGPPDDYEGPGKEVLSDGGTTITWTIPTDLSETGGIDFPYHYSRVER